MLYFYNPFRLIQAVLAWHLGGGIRRGRRHFILYCADMNAAEVSYTPESAWAWVAQDHGPPVVLFSIVVCVSPNWVNPAEQRPTFVPCPDRAPFYPPGELVVACEQEELFYVSTMNDGIDREFVANPEDVDEQVRRQERQRRQQRQEERGP